MMHIVVAPNAFKNCLSATEVARCIAEGLQASRLSCSCTLMPIADGGDGFRPLLLQSLGGRTFYVNVCDPLGRNIEACFSLLSDDTTAIIEMAEASGIRHVALKELNPLRANSYGTGQLIRSALDRGATKIILGLGGSATVDGGAGILSALGFRFMDGLGHELEASPSELVNLHSIDCSQADARIFKTGILLLCDVDNRLLGPEGAARVFGPQKGASPSDVLVLENVLTKMSRAIEQVTGKAIGCIPHGGAAGGVAAGLAGLLNARPGDGIDYFLDLVRFEAALKKAHCLITGEGSIDGQTLKGKGPAGVARRAKRLGLPVIGLAGKLPPDITEDFNRYFDVLLAIGNGPATLESAYQSAAADLRRTAFALGNMLALSKPDGQ